MVEEDRGISTEGFYELVVELAQYSCHILYSYRLSELRSANPSFNDISRICGYVIAELSASDVSTEKMDNVYDVIKLMGECVIAVRDGDHKQMTDCAYHLQDIIDSMKKRSQVDERESIS